jgi:hypothetical protein
MDNVTLSGPLFDGTAARAARDGTTAARKALARHGQLLAQTRLFSHIREHTTGKAISTVTTTDHSVVYQTGKYSMPVLVDDELTDIVITTSLATYGPWLEGTGSRNVTTRFKGYHSFRQAGDDLELAAEAVADRALQPYIGRMS